MGALDILLLLLVIAVIVIAILLFIERTGGSDKRQRTRHEAFTAPFASTSKSRSDDRQKWADDSIAYPTKCVDCERMFPVGERWRGQQTKSLSCEKYASQHGHIDPQHTHPMKEGGIARA